MATDLTRVTDALINQWRVQAIGVGGSLTNELYSSKHLFFELFKKATPEDWGKFQQATALKVAMQGGFHQVKESSSFASAYSDAIRNGLSKESLSTSMSSDVAKLMFELLSQAINPATATATSTVSSGSVSVVVFSAKSTLLSPSSHDIAKLARDMASDSGRGFSKRIAMPSRSSSSTFPGGSIGISVPKELLSTFPGAFTGGNVSKKSPLSTTAVATTTTRRNISVFDCDDLEPHTKLRYGGGGIISYTIDGRTIPATKDTKYLVDKLLESRSLNQLDGNIKNKQGELEHLRLKIDIALGEYKKIVFDNADLCREGDLLQEKIDLLLARESTAFAKMESGDLQAKKDKLEKEVTSLEAQKGQLEKEVTSLEAQKGLHNKVFIDLKGKKQSLGEYIKPKQRRVTFAMSARVIPTKQLEATATHTATTTVSRAKRPKSYSASRRKNPASRNSFHPLTGKGTQCTRCKPLEDYTCCDAHRRQVDASLVQPINGNSG